MRPTTEVLPSLGHSRLGTKIEDRYRDQSAGWFRPVSHHVRVQFTP